MDGNGRWAAGRGLPRTSGHLEGLKTARRIVEAASRLGLSSLTLYVFSTENWARAQTEVDFIMGLVNTHLLRELDFYRANGIRIRYAGAHEALSREVWTNVCKAMDDTKDFDGLQVVLALNYGGRDEIVRAVRRAAGAVTEGGETLAALTADMLSRFMDNPDIPEPELIIRTGGDVRLSNFLLWESAYSELYFSPKFWPDWTEDDLKAAIESFATRERRFGAVPDSGGDSKSDNTKKGRA
jgi:undecaprenyl diphosphate synthase